MSVLSAGLVVALVALVVAWICVPIGWHDRDLDEMSERLAGELFDE